MIQFPYVPPRWDIAPFIMGSFFIALGFLYSIIWSIFLGILFIEFSFLIVGFFVTAYLSRIEYSSNQKQRDFIINYIIFAAATIVITALILGNVYFGFDLRYAIEVYQNNSSFANSPISIDVPNVTLTWIQNLTHSL
jgi:heme/copper-type cytochrome/quinol oxidase subunit 2